MNSRFLALIALAFLVTGCTRIFSIAPVPSDPTPEPVGAPNSQAIPAPAITETGADTEAGPDQSRPEAVEEIDEAIAGQSIDLVIAGAALSEAGAEEAVEAPPEHPEAVNSPAEEVAQPGGEVEAAEGAALVQADIQQRRIEALCREIGNKLGSVSVEDCLAQPLTFAGSYTVQSRPMVVRDFHPEESSEKKSRILILGGIHGDEYSSISIMFRWMELLEQGDNRDFRWRFAPTVNPDGLLDGQAIRQNANGVDLNRNFPSEDWLDLAEDYWLNSTSRNPRRYPGDSPASEPEVQWVVDEIKNFKPDIIVSVHAPYHLLDYDGPPEPPQKIGELHLHLLGVYPGSLGNYAGINLGIPVVTMELPSAGIMPSEEQIVSMWNDLLNWVNDHPES